MTKEKESAKSKYGRYILLVYNNYVELIISRVQTT